MEMTEETINELKNKSTENVQSAQLRGKRLNRNEQSLRVLWDNNKDLTFVPPESQKMRRKTMQR